MCCVASGKVYCVGINDHGQCGIDAQTISVSTTVPVAGLDGHVVIDVAIGYHHGLACTGVSLRQNVCICVIVCMYV